MSLLRSKKPWSIAFILQWGIPSLVALQSCLLLGAFLVGGVISSSKDYANQVFAEKMANRVLALQNEMLNRWSRLDSVATKLAALPFIDAPDHASQDDLREFWQQAAPLLFQLMRSAGVTDSFIILSNSKEPQNDTSTHKALYLRKTDPMLADSDTNLLVGSPHLAQDLDIYFSSWWAPELTLTPQNRALFDKPLSLPPPTSTTPLAGYWARPVSITERSQQTLTYTVPLVDSKGVVRGVFGVGMLSSYFDTLLPAHELASDGLGYLLAVKPANGTDIYPLIPGRQRLQELFPAGKPIHMVPENLPQNIYRAVPAAPNVEPIVACVLPLKIYATQTPFADDTWQLVGFVNESSLYAFPMQIRQTLLISLAASLVLGGILALLFSRQIATPIVNLARSVESSADDMLTSFPRTGVTEIDNLTTAIEIANRNMANTTARLMRIVDMANVPLAAFELKPGMSQVFATERLRLLLLLGEEEATALYSNTHAFMEYLRGIMATPESDEDAIYRINQDVEHWVKIHLASEDGEILGLVSDVTDDMLKKRRIRHERDYDALTGLCSRTFFRRQVSTLMDLNCMMDLGAMLMLDLDKFKSVNDTYGHQCGDDYLNFFAQHMSEFSGIHSIIGRRSGDEFFVCVFRLEDRKILRQTIENFYKRLKAAPYIFPDGIAQPIAVSIGVAWFSGSTDYEALLRAADSALYEAKATGPGIMVEYKK